MEFIPLILIGVVMYVFLILPQQRKAREHNRLLSSLGEGDEVVLNSGIHGFLTELEANVVWLEVSDGVELKVSRSAVASKLNIASEDASEDQSEDA